MGIRKRILSDLSHRLLRCAARKNDGVTVPRIRKISDWAEHIASLGCNAVYFSPILNPTATATTPAISARWTAVSALTRISPPSAKRCTSTASKLCWMAYSIMSDEVSGRSRMCRREKWIPPQGLVPHLL